MFVAQIIIPSIVLTLYLLLTAWLLNQAHKSGARMAQMLYESRRINSTADWIRWYLKKLRNPYLILLKIVTVVALVMIPLHSAYVVTCVLIIFCFDLMRLAGGKRYLHRSAHQSQSS